MYSSDRFDFTRKRFSAHAFLVSDLSLEVPCVYVNKKRVLKVQGCSYSAVLHAMQHSVAGAKL